MLNLPERIEEGVDRVSGVDSNIGLTTSDLIKNLGNKNPNISGLELFLKRLDNIGSKVKRGQPGFYKKNNGTKTSVDGYRRMSLKAKARRKHKNKLERLKTQATLFHISKLTGVNYAGIYIINSFGNDICELNASLVSEGLIDPSESARFIGNLNFIKIDEIGGSKDTNNSNLRDQIGKAILHFENSGDNYYSCPSESKIGGVDGILLIIESGIPTGFILLDNTNDIRDINREIISIISKNFYQTFKDIINSIIKEYYENRLEETIQKLKDVNQMLNDANKDHLTGLLTRNSGLLRIIDTLSLFNRQENDESCSVIIFDIDHFKRVNDTLGHTAGDDVIRLVAELCNSIYRRDVDIKIRWGGEEFVVILPGTSLENTVLLTEKFRKHLEERLIVTSSGKTIKVTSSFGVTSFSREFLRNFITSNGGSLESFIQRVIGYADALLYGSKNSGRNKVTSGLIE